MQANGTKTERITIDISPHEVIELLHNDEIEFKCVMPVIKYKFKRSIGLTANCYVHNGKWCEDTEVRGGSHGWSDTKVHRDVTVAEEKFSDTLEHLEQCLTLLKLES